MTDKAYAVPLHELLASVPREARLVIDDDDGMGTRFIPVGRYCNEAAEALRARLAQPELGVTLTAAKHPVSLSKPSGYKLSTKSLEDVVLEREWIGLTDEEKLTIVRETDNPVDALAATEAKLREKNHAI